MPKLPNQSADDVLDCIVVGCGIIGATIALALRAQGREVTIFDANKLKAGTTPSGGHLKPSWFGGMSKQDYEPAMELLDNVWGLKEEQFKIWPVGSTTVFRVDTDVVKKTQYTAASVTNINLQAAVPMVTLSTGEAHKCRLLIVATGVWAAGFFPEIKITAKQGVSFRFNGTLLRPFIKPWAPFKQVVAHQQASNEIWVGDGSAILESNWTTERTAQCQTRCKSTLGKVASALPSQTLVGLRPYVESGKDPCLFKQVSPRCFVVTGAGKSGTIAAGWSARKIIDATN